MMHLGDVNVGTHISKLVLRLSTTGRQYFANPWYLFSCSTTNDKIAIWIAAPRFVAVPDLEPAVKSYKVPMAVLPFCRRVGRLYIAN
jgi:hypothetical protein